MLSLPSGRRTGVEAAVERVVRVREAVTLTALSRVTLWRTARNGTFPSPMRLGQRATDYRLSVGPARTLGPSTRTARGRLLAEHLEKGPTWADKGSGGPQHPRSDNTETEKGAKR